jgi:hypothetical protein
MPDDRVATSLSGYRELITARDELAARTDWDNPASVAEFNAAQDKLAAHVPPLLDAIERVLKVADGWDAALAGGSRHPHATAIRRAISAELLRPQQGEEAGDGK